VRLGIADSETDAARTALRTSLRPAHLEVEAAYLRDRPGFEHTYGWAWLLKLDDELRGGDDPGARAWSEALVPTRQHG